MSSSDWQIMSYVGPMGAKKSKRIIEEYEICRIRRKNVILFKAKEDKRTKGCKIVSRDGKDVVAQYEVYSLREIIEIIDKKLTVAKRKLLDLSSKIPDEINEKIEQKFQTNSFELKIWLNKITELDEKTLTKLIEIFNEIPEVVIVDEMHFLDQNTTDWRIVQKYCSEISKLANSGIKFIFSGLDMVHDLSPWLTSSFILGISDKVEKLKAACSNCGHENASLSKPLKELTGSYHCGGEDLFAASCRKCYGKKQIENKLDLEHCNTF